MGFRETVAGGDLRGSLEALRDLLAERLEGAEPRETAAIARQLADVILRLDGLPGAEKSELDDLEARRKRRKAKVS